VEFGLMRFSRAAAGIAALALVALAASGAIAAKPTADPAPGKTETAKPLPPGLDPEANPDPYPSTYHPAPSAQVAIINADILDASAPEIPRGTVLMADGKIDAVGPTVMIPDGAKVIDAKGRYVTPGLIDPHSHLGVYPSPQVEAMSDGNEATDPNTAQVWAEHSIWPQDPGFQHALAGGVTTLQILPGSANLFGGRSAIIKNVWSDTAQGMKFPGAPYGL
jgi:imidazolonepropionase-like amidohydrolase